MAKFEYEWQGSDRARKRGEIEAPDRETAFALLRERGIRAIRVEPKGWERGKGYRGMRSCAVAAIAAAAALTGGVAAVLAWRMLSSAALDGEGRQIAVEYGGRTASRAEQVVVAERRVAKARPRRYLPDWPILRERLDTIFAHPSERVLALFAQPGERNMWGLRVELDEEDLYEALDDDIFIEVGEDKSVSSLKRIVAGMKREIAMLLSMGKSAREIEAYLVERQKMEINCRREMIADWNPSAPDAEARRSEIEAQLSAMNFAPLGD